MADAAVTTSSKYNPDIKTFNGTGDIAAWLTRVELVSKMTKNADLASLIPLHLEGGALAVYMEMAEDVKSDGEKLKNKLLDVFGDGAFRSFGKLVTLRYQGDSVEVYAHQLKTFARLVGLTGDAQNIVVKYAFIRGFPESVGINLQQIPDIKNVPLQVVIERARILMENKMEGLDAINASFEPTWRQTKKNGYVGDTKSVGGASQMTAQAGVGHRPASQVPVAAQHAAGNKAGFQTFPHNFKCFICDGVGHFAKNCTQRKPVTCFKCGMPGHLSFRCTQNQGN